MIAFLNNFLVSNVDIIKKWLDSMFSIKNNIKLSWLSKVNFFGKWSTKAQFATKIFKLKIISKSRKITQEILTT